jgi:hypothetical protein
VKEYQLTTPELTALDGVVVTGSLGGEDPVTEGERRQVRAMRVCCSNRCADSGLRLIYIHFSYDEVYRPDNWRRRTIVARVSNYWRDNKLPSIVESSKASVPGSFEAFSAV